MVHQQLRYRYPGPIRDLNHRLVIIPPEQFGDQRRLEHQVEVSFPEAVTSFGEDDFGNVVLDVHVPMVRRAIAFEAWIVVERRAAPRPREVPKASLTDQRLLDFTALTTPNAELRRAAARLARGGETGLALADRVNRWVFGAMHYQYGVTGVATTAAQAFAVRHGVCQDYAHVMIALCRQLAIPASYVSGHLLGEGAPHAWVEVLAPDDSGDGAVAVAFDPTHGRQANLGYVTVAVGRDYADVAPTSGTYRASHSGHFSSRKRVTLTAVEYAA